MLKTTIASLLLATMPIQHAPKAPTVPAPNGEELEVVPMRLDVVCNKGMCMVPHDQLRGLVESNANAGRAALKCQGGKEA